MRAKKIERPLSVARMDRVRPKVNLQRVLKHCSGQRPTVRPGSGSSITVLNCEMFEWPDSPIRLSSAIFPLQCGLGKEEKKGGGMWLNEKCELPSECPPPFFVPLPVGRSGVFTSLEY